MPLGHISFTTSLEVSSWRRKRRLSVVVCGWGWCVWWSWWCTQLGVDGGVFFICFSLAALRVVSSCCCVCSRSSLWLSLSCCKLRAPGVVWVHLCSMATQWCLPNLLIILVCHGGGPSQGSCYGLALVGYGWSSVVPWDSVRTQVWCVRLFA